jgi:hypothetical protein
VQAWPDSLHVSAGSSGALGRLAGLGVPSSLEQAESVSAYARQSSKGERRSRGRG